MFRASGFSAYLVMTLFIKLTENTKSLTFMRKYGPRKYATIKYTILDRGYNKGEYIRNKYYLKIDFKSFNNTYWY